VREADWFHSMITQYSDESLRKMLAYAENEAKRYRLLMTSCERNAERVRDELRKRRILPVENTKYVNIVQRADDTIITDGRPAPIARDLPENHHHTARARDTDG
jgi:hypothetical protein